jgi:TonB-linked SusC/RagA family outer membrane protein
MKKKWFKRKGYYSLFKWLCIMKLTMFFLLMSLIQVSANVYSQQTKLNITVKNVSVREVLKQIEDQSEFFFLYKNENIDVDRIVSIDLKEKPVEDVLNKIFKGTNVSFEIVNRQIVLVDKGNMTSTSQQQKTVSGKVTDVTGNALPGVTVVVKGSSSGTITDSNGNFSIQVPGNVKTIMFSFVGMKSQEVEIAGKTTINVVLQEESIGIQEVVAVGYGTNKKVNVTGAISSINSKEIASVSSSNLTDNLTGKLPGLRVLQRTSEPGDYNSSYNIRGWGTPLVIVDGVQRDNFNKIDPNEIESVTVLKDASAAIYGVKAANGVLLITTHRGKDGDPEITLNSKYGWQNITTFPHPMNAAQWVEVTNEANMNAGSSLPYTSEDLEKYRNGTYKSTDWYGLVVQNNSPQQQHNLSVSGGSKKIKYFSSIGYTDQDGIWKSGSLNYNRYNIRANVTAQISENLDAELSLGAIVDKKNAPSTDTWVVFKSIWMQKPIISAYANNDENYLSNVADGTHPLAVTNSSISGYNNTENKNFTGSFALNYKIPFISGLKLRFLYGYDIYFNHQKKWSKQYTLYDYDSSSSSYTSYLNNNPSSLYEYNSELDRSTMQTSLSYERIFNNEHNVKALLLFENLRTKADNFYGNKYFAVDAVDQLYAGSSTNQSISSDSDNIYELANQGLVGRFNYDYLSKYLVEYSFRYDGSSKFKEGHRWGFFPAVSLGWRISEEDFMKNTLPFVTNLKLRGSWGQLGDDSASSYQFLTGYTYPSGNYLFGSTVTSGLGFKGMANENITWYKATTKNIGIEGNLWNNKINFQFDVFRRERTGLLSTRQLSLPATVGADLPQENLNSDRSNGYEIVLGHSNKIGEVWYNISGNFSYARNENRHVEESDQGNSYLNWKNKSTNRWDNIVWGYNCIGQFQSFDEIYSSPIEDSDGNRKLLPGDLKYEDVNKDGIIDDYDKKPILRNNTPEVNYGISLSAGYKGFDFNILFQGATRFNVQLQEQFKSPLPWGRNGLAQYYDRWHHSDLFDESSAWVPGKYPSTRLSGTSSWNTETSTFNVLDGSYLRIKNIEIGYTIPSKCLRKTGIHKLRVYVNGYNLYTWSKIDYVDPEHSMDTYGYLYPITRNFNIGVNASF